jgi:hypothetical protein
MLDARKRLLIICSGILSWSLETLVRFVSVFAFR